MTRPIRLALFTLLLALAGCSASRPPDPSPTPTVTLVTAAPPVVQPPPTPKVLVATWTPTPPPPTLTPSPTPDPLVAVAAEPGLPAALAAAAQALVEAAPEALVWRGSEAADVTVGFDPLLPLGHWVYAVVAPFATIPDEVTLADLEAAWRGEASGPFAGRPLLVSPETAAALAGRLGGEPAGVQTLAAADLLDAAWADRPAWAVVPFEALEPRWKVLRLDGRSPLDRPLDLAAYPLARPVGLKGRVDQVEKVWAALGGPAAGLTNRDESRLTVLAMTGVTALVRATAFEMEIQGVTYPGEAVAEVMQAADIAHVSNEVSFAADCPYPNPARQEGNLRFCSADRYLELLEYVGVDVVELTGNHINDWGTLPFSRTLGMYRERGWGTFGGGVDALAAGQPLTITHQGNTIGLIGCNPAGPQFAWATADSPGSAYCTIESLAVAVSQLATQVDVVVVGIQYHEYDSYAPTALQKADFLALAAAGADIVSGSQGHHAQGFALPEGSLIHFGLGNLFFDQMDQLGTRQTFIDRHVIYDGRHIATDLWTGLIENYARPRPMTADERAALLQAVFGASGW